MPNYCYNELYCNQNAGLQEVLAFMGEDFDFNKLIPYPPEFAERDAEAEALREKYGWGEGCKNWDANKTEAVAAWKAFVEKWGNEHDGFNSGGAEWCQANWGTKWNAIEPHLEGAHLVFESAWGPPFPVIIALAKKFPQFTFYFEYFESGMAFCGGFTLACQDDWWGPGEWEPGKLQQEWEGKYHGHKGG